MTQVLDSFLFKIMSILQNSCTQLSEKVKKEEVKSVTPFLKWAGGKRQILSELEKHLPKNFNNYFEPFLGGGSFYFYLKNHHKINGNSYLSDCNEELINTYKQIQESPIELMKILEKMKKTHSKEYFYEVRAWDRKANFKKINPMKRAARLIYLNKTCFNGIWRTNLSGQNNVPFGNHMTPKLYDAENILACSRFLNQNTELNSWDYKEILENAKKGDFIFLDPPYDSFKAQTGFTSYNGSKFCRDMQQEVYDLFVNLDKKGCFVMVTNNATDYIKELFARYQKTSTEIGVKRYVNSKGQNRDEVQEIIIKNY